MENGHRQLPLLLDITKLLGAAQGAEADAAIWVKEATKGPWACKAIPQGHKIGSPLPSPAWSWHPTTLGTQDLFRKKGAHIPLPLTHTL